MKILVLNCGSSSIKYKLFDMTTKEVLAQGGIEKIGLPDSFLKFTLPNGEKITCAVTRGMVDFTDNRAQILCESALYPYEINEDEEASLLEEAKLELSKKQGEKEYALWQLSLNKAVNHLKVKNKQKNINL